MIVGIISDTHGSLCGWEKAFKLMKKGGCERIYHLGDVLYHGPRNPIPDCYDPKNLAERISSSEIEMRFVRGNCDAEIDYDVLGIEKPGRFVVEELDGLKLFLTHGHDPKVDEAVEISREEGVDILFHGHTHVLRVEKVGNLLIVNPGSPSLPKGGDPPSFAILDTEGRNVVILSLEGDIIEEVKI